MGLRPKKLWALVTDSGCGRLFELERSPRRIEEILNREATARSTPSRDLTTDLSGRESGSATHAGDTKHPRSDAHDEEERKFVQEWVEGLQGALLKGRFEHIMLIADPRTLGRLRGGLDKTLKEAVIAEDARNLTKLKTEDLEPQLRELAGWPA